MNTKFNNEINEYLSNNGLYLHGMDFRKLDTHEITATIVSYEYNPEYRKFTIVVKPVFGISHIDVSIEIKNDL